MAKVSEMIESKYLKQSDVESDTVVTIQKVGKVNVAKEGEDPEMKWLIRFEQFSKPMVLNATNIKRIARACGDDTDEWIGKQVVVYVDPDVEFAGNVVGGLRVRAVVKQQATTQREGAKTGSRFDGMADDIPF